jgi:DNA mismatch repair protein MutH
MSSLIYLSYKNDEAVLDKDFQFIVLANGLNLLSESTYRLMMGQLADICQTEKPVSVTLLKQWLGVVELELAAYLAQRDDKQDIVSILRQLKTLLVVANQDNASTVISCCV